MDAFLLSIITADFEYFYSLQSQMNSNQYSLLSNTAKDYSLLLLSMDALVYSNFLVRFTQLFLSA